MVEWRPGRRRRGGTGEGRRRTGERPGGVVLQGSRGVEVAELGRRSGMVGDVDGARGRRRSRRRDGSRGDDGGAAQIKNCAQVLEEDGGRREIYGGSFVPGGATTRDKRAFCPGSWLHLGQKRFSGRAGKIPSPRPTFSPGWIYHPGQKGPVFPLSRLMLCLFLFLFTSLLFLFLFTSLLKLAFIC